MAERVGVREIVFRLFSGFYCGLPALSASTSWPRTRFTAGFVRLPSFSDFAGVMALEMTLEELPSKRQRGVFDHERPPRYGSLVVTRLTRDTTGCG